MLVLNCQNHGKFFKFLDFGSQRQVREPESAWFRDIHPTNKKYKFWQDNLAIKKKKNKTMYSKSKLYKNDSNVS